LQKKVGLDAGDQKIFRPVSNLPFLSKLLERAVKVRLQAFLDYNRLMPSTQSAYRKFHSTETAVTRVYNDLLLATALCMLDPTAAFDTVDHSCYGDASINSLRGTAIAWCSYLSGRTYRVVYTPVIPPPPSTLFARLLSVGPTAVCVVYGRPCKYCR